MTPERWQVVKKVLAGALEKAPGERSVYLDHACTDPDLRREVESLIAAHEQGDNSFLEQPRATSVPLQKGAQLGQYTILARIGAGGMGEVYRAHDTKLKRDVAIKVLPSFVSRDPDRLRRFEQEARAAAALNHPNILAVFQMGTYEGAPYLVSELLEGATLREQLKRGPMPLRKVIDCGVQVARGLAAAHEKGIVHRDLKPENLFVTKDGRVKILDFGLAKLTQHTEEVDLKAPTVSDLTEPGAVMGTVGYMSPEQVSGKAADHRADIFAFGAILYEMLTGKRAFQKPTSAETMSAILNEDPPGVAQLTPTTPAVIQRVVQRCMGKSPEQRFQSASDLAFALEALSDSGSAPKPVPAKQIKAIDSLAVLPLENASGDPEADYLSDGISETLINSLAQLRKIRDVPRTLAFQYRVAGVESLRAGRELGVSAVLAGRMVQRGDDLIVSVELVDVDRQAQLWGGRYSRKMTDLVGLQEELTTEISEKLRLRLTGEERKRLHKRPTQINEAYRLVLQAQHQLSKQSPAGIRTSIALCQRAIDIDPLYAAAYAWLGYGYVNLGLSGYASPMEGYPQARAAARKALELDVSLPEAHAALGYGLLYSWDFAGAESELRKSLELNPELVQGYEVLRVWNLIRGRSQEAIAAAKRAIELDPLSWWWVFSLGRTYYYTRRFDNAIELERKTVEIAPDHSIAHVFLVDACAYAGQSEKAIEECEKALAHGRNALVSRLYAAATYAKVGRIEEARTILYETEKAWSPGSPGSHLIGGVYARLGQQEKAFEWLERSFQEREAFLVYLKVSPLYDSLRGDPRFDTLVKRIGIPD